MNSTPPEQLEHLKKVKVHSEAVAYASNVRIESEESRQEARRLPEDRRKPPLFQMGVKDPVKVPVGKISLREAIDMIRGRALDPQTFSVEYLAEFHQMDPEHVYHLLDRFKTFEVYNNDVKARRDYAPWYDVDRLADIMVKNMPLAELATAQQEEERRQAWRQFLEEKRRQEQERPSKQIEIAGLTALPSPPAATAAVDDRRQEDREEKQSLASQPASSRASSEEQARRQSSE